ncbi:MAG: C_GCAxxG_C_C family protein [Dehalococcoidales bacterium]|nr:C_GCAxxG_C_C family protein [Dehalococcoidales bacterium]
MPNDIPEKAYQLGNEFEKIYGGCSQCVIAALQDAFDKRNDDVFKAGSGLAAGGGGFTDGNCGAYSGAVMFLSLLCGRERDDFKGESGGMFRSFALAGKLHEKFIQEYGSVICRDIQTKVFGRPYYLADPDDFAKFEAAGAHTVHCPDIVGKSARWTAEIIQEEGLL